MKGTDPPWPACVGFLGAYSFSCKESFAVGSLAIVLVGGGDYKIVYLKKTLSVLSTSKPNVWLDPDEQGVFGNEFLRIKCCIRTQAGSDHEIDCVVTQGK